MQQYLTMSYKEEFKYFKETYSDRIQEMFAAVSKLYADYWHDLFHFALFENEEESWETAFDRTHERYMGLVDVKNASNILVLACGRGGFSNIIAQNTQGNVLGVDLSKSQLSHTKKYKRPNLSFRQLDIMKTGDLDMQFDAAVFLDAACYLPDKNKALSEIAKVLKPGAKLLIVDWCKEEGLTKIQEELVLYPFMKHWAIPSLETKKSYSRYFKKNGFKIHEITDLNDKAKRNWEFGYESALKGVKKLSVKDTPALLWTGLKLGPKGVEILKGQFPAAIYIKVGFDVGFLRYTLFLVEKT